MLISPGPFDYERHSLRWILYRLMGENQNLELLCKYVPRLASAAANIAKIEAAIQSRKPSAEADAVRQALRDLIEERTDNEEETSW